MVYRLIIIESKAQVILKLSYMHWSNGTKKIKKIIESVEPQKIYLYYQINKSFIAI